tara:strand:+ start:2030 stop:2185 length:156 start_codon:yes stop_codon:yes gene_type:complete
MNKNHTDKCYCDHCREIEKQQDRLQTWQSKRQDFYRFIEDKAADVRPELRL